MIKKIKTYMIMSATTLTFAAVALVVPITASAACSNIANSVGEGAKIAAGPGSNISCGTDPGAGGGGLATLAQNTVTVFSMIVGVVAVIMIIYGGFRYITSGGDSGRVSTAKNSLIYAIVGLIIVALAQLIVHFVLNQTGKAAG